MKITTGELRQGFINQKYICDEDIIITVFLALKLKKPLLLTGAPGVGKTEIAKVLAKIFDTELIRLQCYEGLDDNKALYEWNYQRQLLKIQMSKSEAGNSNLEKSIFTEEYLLERPLLKAIRMDKTPVLLIDEIDKTDEEFEAFLFEVLSDFQVSIPELGTVTAKQIPIVILTSNGERDLSDGLKRRCIFLYVDYPSVDKELQIIRAKVPEVGEKLSMQVAKAMNAMRGLDLKKPPAISEAIDWANALIEFEVNSLEPKIVDATLNVILKDRDDQETFRKDIGAKGLVESINK
ncbi:MAG: MoxR family ATPase [Bacillota bacterium]|nr:MoxR family ATPase [Bacillota bacterium]